MLFDRVCTTNGIRHLLTAPYSPTTTGKIERLHKTIRAEFLIEHDRQHATIEDAQAALDAWVVEYNTERPHQSCGGRPPLERFARRAQSPRRRGAGGAGSAAAGGVAAIRGEPLGRPERPDLTRRVRLRGRCDVRR